MYSPITPTPTPAPRPPPPPPLEQISILSSIVIKLGTRRMGPRAKTWPFAIPGNPLLLPLAYALHTHQALEQKDRCLAIKHHGMSTNFYFRLKLCLLPTYPYCSYLITSVACWRRNKDYLLTYLVVISVNTEINFPVLEDQFRIRVLLARI
jgi:hypothetical protein